MCLHDGAVCELPAEINKQVEYVELKSSSELSHLDNVVLDMCLEITLSSLGSGCRCTRWVGVPVSHLKHMEAVLD